MADRTPSSRGEATRERILDEAERLMAERGIAGVSLNEINLAAGQRNKAALHYHFGGREGLLRAILDRHRPRLESRHDELYAEWLRRGDRDDVRGLVEVLVLPLADYIGKGRSQRAVVRIWAAALGHPDLAVEDFGSLVDPALTQASRSLVEVMAQTMPREFAVERLVAALQGVVHVLADRALLEDSTTSRRRALPLDLFASNLVDMTAGALTAPVGDATCHLLGPGRVRPAQRRAARSKRARLSVVGEG